MCRDIPSSMVWIVWLWWITANVCQPSRPATYISFPQLIATVTRATRNILSYHLLPSLLKESIRMRECKRDFVLLNVQVCACLCSCAYSKTQAGKQCNSKAKQTTGLYISMITVWNSKPHTQISHVSINICFSDTSNIFFSLRNHNSHVFWQQLWWTVDGKR